MDLLFWINIYQTSASSQTIIDRIQLSDFRKIYKDRTLFHHFGSDLNLMKALHKKYTNTVKNRQCYEDILMPLTLLYPDQMGLTSIDWALRKKRPRIFELMLDMVRMVGKDYAYTKMMIPAFP